MSLVEGSFAYNIFLLLDILFSLCSLLNKEFLSSLFPLIHVSFLRCVQDERLAKFVVGSHIRHHPTHHTSNGVVENGYHAHLEETCKVEQIPQDLLRKYIVYSKEKIKPKLHQVDQDKVAKLYADLRKESMVRGGGVAFFGGVASAT